MSLLRLAVIYTALALGANAAAAQPAALEGLIEGDMRKLVFAAEPAPVSDTPFTDIEDGEFRLSDWQGKVVLVNFWATWCAPCREEMPALDALNAEFGGENFEVLTVATGRNPPQVMTAFFEETGIETLPLLRDPRQQLAREMAVMGLPVSVILDREGREIARLTGDADWHSDSARAVIGALLATD